MSAIFRNCFTGLLGKLSMFHINGFVFLCCIFVKLYLSLNGNYFGFILGFVLSGLLSYYVLDKFNYAENIIINFLKRALFIFTLIFCGLIVYFIFMYYFDLFAIIECSSMNDSDHIPSSSSTNSVATRDSSSASNSVNSKNIISVVESSCSESNKSKSYDFSINKEKLDSLIDGAVTAVGTIVNNVIPNLGAGAAAGAVGCAIVKATAKTPLGSRVLAIGAATGASALSVQTGLNVGNRLTRNLDLNELVKDSAHVTSDKDTIPSPTDSSFISSVLENSEIISPLEELLADQLTLNFLILILLFSFLYLLFSINV